jgi:hypothetical protein
MHNQAGPNMRRCLYCGNQFVPINGAASFCCYGHYQMYMRGDVHIPPDAIADVIVMSDTQHPFPKPSPPGVARRTT